MKRARDRHPDPSPTDKGAKRARDGNLDPSSTDKDAADETDEVELHVLCLTGEGVTFSVSRSMLGSDLRRLVSEKLPRKPGAKLAVHHTNRELTLDENLGEQGFVGKSARCPAPTYQLMCIQHGVIPVGSQMMRKSLHWKVLHILKEQHMENIYIISPAALQVWLLTVSSTKAWSG